MMKCWYSREDKKDSQWLLIGGFQFETLEDAQKDALEMFEKNKHDKEFPNLKCDYKVITQYAIVK